MGVGVGEDGMGWDFLFDVLGSGLGFVGLS